MKIQITRVNTWSDESSILPQSIELVVDGFCVLDGEPGPATDSFIEGFVVALDTLSQDYDYEVEDIFE